MASDWRVAHAGRRALRAVSRPWLWVAALAFAAACGGEGGPGENSEADVPAFRGEEEVRAMVGPEGAVLVLDKAVALRIPVGALDQPVDVRVSRAEVSELEAGEPSGRLVSDLVRFEPHGLRFEKPITVELRLSRDGIEDDRLEMLRLDDEQDERWEPVMDVRVLRAESAEELEGLPEPERELRGSRRLAAETMTFSIYAAAEAVEGSGGGTSTTGGSGTTSGDDAGAGTTGGDGREGGAATGGSLDMDGGGSTGNATAGNGEDAGAVATSRDRSGISWIDHFGTGTADRAHGVALDETGEAAYVAGQTFGALPGQSSSGIGDAYLRKYDLDGMVVWTRQFGTSSEDEATSVAIDSNGDVLVAGNALAALPGQDFTADGAFVRKYTAAGVELWTHQATPDGDPLAANSYDTDAVAVASDGSVVFAGQARALFLGGQTDPNGDVFVRKLDSAGSEVWTRIFGSDGVDSASGVAVDADGNVLVTGLANGTVVTGVDRGTVLRKYDGAGNVLWTRQLESPSPSTEGSVRADAEGDVLVAEGGLLVRFDAAGMERWSEEIYPDSAVAADFDPTGDVVLVGFTEAPEFGVDDVLIAGRDASGNPVWRTQIGGAGDDYVRALVVGTAGDLYIVGRADAPFDGESVGTGAYLLRWSRP